MSELERACYDASSWEYLRAGNKERRSKKRNTDKNRKPRDVHSPWDKKEQDSEDARNRSRRS